MPPDNSILRAPRRKGKGLEIISEADSRRAYIAGKRAGEDFAFYDPHADASRADDYGTKCAYRYAGDDMVRRGYYLDGFIAAWQRRAIR